MNLAESTQRSDPTVSGGLFWPMAALIAFVVGLVLGLNLRQPFVQPFGRDELAPEVRWQLEQSLRNDWPTTQPADLLVP